MAQIFLVIPCLPQLFEYMSPIATLPLVTASLIPGLYSASIMASAPPAASGPCKST